MHQILAKKKAVMLTEIYFKNDLWRIAAIGQGFNGGLSALFDILVLRLQKTLLYLCQRCPNSI